MSFGTSLFGYLILFDRDGEVLKGIITDGLAMSSKNEECGTVIMEFWYVVLSYPERDELFLVLPTEIIDLKE